VLKYVQHDDAQHEVSDHYKDQPCPLAITLWNFEKTEIGFVDEKDKQLNLERIEVMISSGVVPRIYMEMAYNFLIGCLWIKFTPI